MGLAKLDRLVTKVAQLFLVGIEFDASMRVEE